MKHMVRRTKQWIISLYLLTSSLPEQQTRKVFFIKWRSLLILDCQITAVTFQKPRWSSNADQGKKNGRGRILWKWDCDTLLWNSLRVIIFSVQEFIVLWQQNKGCSSVLLKYRWGNKAGREITHSLTLSNIAEGKRTNKLSAKPKPANLQGRRSAF